MSDVRPPRLLPPVALAALIAVSVAGCKTTRSSDTTGSVATSRAQASQGGVRDVDAWAERYRVKPGDPEIAMAYSQALRANGQRAQGVAVLEQAAILHGKNPRLLGAYGRALADVGNHQQAYDVLVRAHSPDQPDWRILSVMGAVLDQLGRHQEAQRHYQTALRIVPGEPTVLSNLGLSYALSKDLPRAEATLREAAARPPIDGRVRQNLALVVGLRGRFGEAESIARADLPPDEAAANVAYLRQMLAQPDSLKTLNGNGAPGPQEQTATIAPAPRKPATASGRKPKPDGKPLATMDIRPRG